MFVKIGTKTPLAAATVPMKVKVAKSETGGVRLCWRSFSNSFNVLYACWKSAWLPSLRTCSSPFLSLLCSVLSCGILNWNFVSLRLPNVLACLIMFILLRTLKHSAWNTTGAREDWTFKDIWTRAIKKNNLSSAANTTKKSNPRVSPSWRAEGQKRQPRDSISALALTTSPLEINLVPQRCPLPHTSWQPLTEIANFSFYRVSMQCIAQSLIWSKSRNDSAGNSIPLVPWWHNGGYPSIECLAWFQVYGIKSPTKVSEVANLPYSLEPSAICNHGTTVQSTIWRDLRQFPRLSPKSYTRASQAWGYILPMSSLCVSPKCSTDRRR